jgi:hypothetical protein
VDKFAIVEFVIVSALIAMFFVRTPEKMTSRLFRG